jgi:NADPH-dependent 2,4-dienoyl-CoA reductase/sulfur reductase-like enzyme
VEVKKQMFYQNVILGGGVVAGYAAQAFVEEGLKPGNLAIVSAEEMLPYDRPPLSKGFLLGKTTREDILLNEPSFYQNNGIDTYLNNPAIQVDFADRKLTLADDSQIEFEQLLIATGSRLRRFDLPGSDLNGIYYLRYFDDSRHIRQAAQEAERAVVIGGSFIGMEVASGLRHYGVKTTMVFPEERVWQAFFTPLMSSFFENYYRERGVEFLTEAKINAFTGQQKVQVVQISQGDRQHNLPADLVVAGIGVDPNVELFAETELNLDEGILVDRFLETNIKGVFAAGDVARYPDQIFDRFRRVEHWDNAFSQGQHAARLMMGKREPYIHVPYFFSDVFDLSYEFWGDTSQADVTVHRGDVEGGSFSVWWLANKRLQAAFVMDRPDEERELAPEWIRAQQPISADELADPDRPLKEMELTPA